MVSTHPKHTVTTHVCVHTRVGTRTGPNKEHIPMEQQRQ